MKLSDEQLASLTSPKAVNEYIKYERENIIEVIKQNLAVGDIFKRENLQVTILRWHALWMIYSCPCSSGLLYLDCCFTFWENKLFVDYIWLQVATDEVVKEVANSIEEFKKHKQEYNEERIKEQV